MWEGCGYAVLMRGGRRSRSIYNYIADRRDSINVRTSRAHHLRIAIRSGWYLIRECIGFPLLILYLPHGASMHTCEQYEHKRNEVNTIGVVRSSQLIRNEPNRQAKLNNTFCFQNNNNTRTTKNENCWIRIVIVLCIAIRWQHERINSISYQLFGFTALVCSLVRPFFHHHEKKICMRSYLRIPFVIVSPLCTHYTEDDLCVRLSLASLLRLFYRVPIFSQ